MPKATAVWLLENTALTFKQIADFCQMHILEVETLANEESSSIMGFDPISSGQLTWEEIDLSSKDPERALTLEVLSISPIKAHAKYTPLARRQDKPNAIAWILKNYPQVPDSKTVRLIGTTKASIENIRNKSHWNYANIKPQSPVLLGLCTQAELDKILIALEKKASRQERTADRKK